nr:isoleucine N-monooxygenase 1-like [Ipomoea batatas]
MLRNKPVFRWMINLMAEMNTEIACFRLGGTNVISVTSPEVAREILKKQDTVFASRPTCMSAELASGNFLISLFSPLGDQWKKMRRVLTSHVLSPNTLNWLPTSGPRKPTTSQMVFSKRFFGAGTEDGGPGVEEEEHIDATFGVLAYVYSFGVSDYFPWLRMFDLDGHRKALKKAVEGVRKYQDPEVDERIRMWNDGTKTEQEDILDVLINLRCLTSEEIKAHLLELMVTIVDNPSNAVEWVLAEMLNQPEILIRAMEELDNVVGRERLVQESDLSKLNYLNACLKEVFRVHPLSSFVPPHLCSSDTTVSNYFIPKGSHVIISRHGLGRNPKNWEEPLKFKPERHLKNDGSEVSLVDPEVRVLTFSAGRRGCPGVQLGSLVSGMLLGRILQGFEWSVPREMNGGRIDLKESKDSLLLAKPLNALAKPRLPHYLIILVINRSSKCHNNSDNQFLSYKWLSKHKAAKQFPLPPGPSSGMLPSNA